jgi:hypothetical protein
MPTHHLREGNGLEMQAGPPLGVNGVHGEAEGPRLSHVA